MDWLTTLYTTTVISNSFWHYLTLAALSGVIGGIGRILLNGEYEMTKFYMSKQSEDGIWTSTLQPFYKIIFNFFDWNPSRTLVVFGSIKEPFIGALGAIIATLMFYGGIHINHLIYLSLIAGFGSSYFLKKYLHNITSVEFTGMETDIEQVEIEVDYKDSSNEEEISNEDKTQSCTHEG